MSRLAVCALVAIAAGMACGAYVALSHNIMIIFVDTTDFR